MLDRPASSRQARSAARSAPAKAVSPKPGRGGGSRDIFEVLRARILALELPPGADLEEAALVRAFGRSRTPVREALIQLAGEGLVQLVPNRGARVAPLDLDQVPELLETLELYERAVTRWAAARRRDADLDRLEVLHRAFAEAARTGDLAAMAESNRQFHGIIADGCGNRVLAADCRAIEWRTLRLARAAFGQARAVAEAEAEFRISVEQHAAIIAALRARDAEAADELIRAHCAIFRRRIATFITASAAGDLPLGLPAVSPPDTEPARS